MNYYLVGEIAGKTYRLGHPNESLEQSYEFSRRAMREFGVPESEQWNFAHGFNAGVTAVDVNRQEVVHDAVKPAQQVSQDKERAAVGRCAECGSTENLGTTRDNRVLCASCAEQEGA